jgi:acyl carrier protein
MSEPLDVTENMQQGESSEAVAAVLGIIRELLKNEDIGPDDDFFLAGGHSLLGTQLVIRARKAFGVKIALRDLFATGTAAKLAGRIEELVMEEVSAMSDDEVARMAETK